MFFKKKIPAKTVPSTVTSHEHVRRKAPRVWRVWVTIVVYECWLQEVTFIDFDGITCLLTTPGLSPHNRLLITKSDCYSL